MAEALGTLVLVLAVVAVIAALWALVTCNSLIRLRNLVQESWKQIDVELQRRHDLIPNLVETVKGYASHERATLEAVTNARAAAVAPGQSVADQASSENFLTGALKGLLAVSESYPELKADALFAQLKAELATTEDRLAASRRFYNANVRQLNTRVETVPVNMVANAFGVSRQDYFEIDDAARTAPEVRF